MNLNELVPDGGIVVELSTQERDACITELVQALINCEAVDSALEDELTERVLLRESRGSTGFGRGVAVPHVKHPSVQRMTAAIGLSSSGVDFNSMDKQPVYSIFLLISPEDRPEDHLQAMEIIFKNLSKETFRRLLRQSTEIEDVRALLEEADAPS